MRQFGKILKKQKKNIKYKEECPTLRWGQCFYHILDDYLDKDFLLMYAEENGLYEIIDCGTCRYLVEKLIKEED